MRLDRRQPGDDADERRTGRQAELAAQLAAPGRRRDQRIEVEAERHHHHLIVAADAPGEHVAPDPRRHGDQRAGAARQHALRGDDEARLQRREVPVEHVPVVGVDDDRHAAQRRRDPAERAGLRRVGVDDVRPERPHQPDQPPEGRPVPPPFDLPAERGQRHEPLRLGAVQRQVVALGVADLSGDQARVVARGIQPLVEEQRMEGRPADVHARNDAEHTDARLRGVMGGSGHGGLSIPRRPRRPPSGRARRPPGPRAGQGRGEAGQRPGLCREEAGGEAGGRPG